MKQRVALDEPAPAAPRPNPLRLASRNRRERGQGVFRYDRGLLARICGLEVSGIRTAERRSRLDVSDLVSVARFIVRRVERRARKAARP